MTITGFMGFMLVSRAFQMLQDASGLYHLDYTWYQWSLFTWIPHLRCITQTQCCPSAPGPFSLRTVLSAGSQQHNSLVLFDPVLLLHSNPVWMWVHMCMICFLTLAKDRFLFLSAVSSAARHLYCFPASSQRAQSQCLSLFGCFPFLLSCFTLPHSSAQKVWTTLRNSGNWTKKWHKCRHDFSISSWSGALYRRQNWKRSQKEQMLWSPVSLLACSCCCRTSSFHTDATGSEAKGWDGLPPPQPSKKQSMKLYLYIGLSW